MREWAVLVSRKLLSFAASSFAHLSVCFAGQLKSAEDRLEEQQQKTNGAWTQQLTLEQKIQQLESSVQEEARLRKNMLGTHPFTVHERPSVCDS